MDLVKEIVLNEAHEVRLATTCTEWERVSEGCNPKRCLHPIILIGGTMQWWNAMVCPKDTRLGSIVNATISAVNLPLRGGTTFGCGGGRCLY